MMYWSLVFLIGAILAALFAFGIFASAMAGLARVLFYLFLALFVVILVARLVVR
jgi:uncharacterized membrane protein YtjA (UPF0391 family)